MKTKVNLKEKASRKTKMNRGILALILAALLLITLAGCGNKVPDSAANGAIISADREGNPITLPAKVERIIVMGPSNTEVLAELGFADIIIAADEYSADVSGIKEGIPLFSMMTPDAEQIISLQPDVIFVTGMSKSGGEDPFKAAADAGICIIYIPSSSSINGIKEDIRYMAAVMGAQEKGEAIITDMEKEIEGIRQVGETIAAKKKVYFEISAAPHMYSSGRLTFLNEMIELIGAENIFAEQETDWMSVSDEAVLTADPDVILTSVNYIENPGDEIKSRPGWNEIRAVKDAAVYYINTDASNRPSHNIVKALKEIAEAVYPDEYN